jgi:protein-S-isoprenylcysteine O-methyltransferase Ste14
MQTNAKSAVTKDVVQFAIPAVIVFFLELLVLAQDGLHGFWGQIWDVITQPSAIAELPSLTVAGMLLFAIGLAIMCCGQVTLFRNYSGTVVIRRGHELVTHGIYSYVRNPMYFGLILVTVVGLGWKRSCSPSTSRTRIWSTRRARRG